MKNLMYLCLVLFSISISYSQTAEEHYDNGVTLFQEGKFQEVTDGILEVQLEYIEHLQNIKSDYESHVNNLKIELTSFLAKNENENTKTIQKVVTKSEETIDKGIKEFETISQKIESSNNEKIEAIDNLLEHYKSVVEASSSLIETLTAIDFPTKLDALSSKSQLMIESITSARQTLEIKLNETQNSIIDKMLVVKEQVIQYNENKTTLLIEKITEANSNLKTAILDSFETQSKQAETSFENLNTLIVNGINQTNIRLNKQDKETSTLKTLLIVTIGIGVIGIIINLIFK